MHRIVMTLMVAALAHLAALAPALAAKPEKRVALVLGNSAYQNTAPLKNPRNDATDMAIALRRLGFTVIDGIDLDRAGMEERVRRFAAALSDADVSLFYYAGHGMQVNGENYLAPVDASLKSEADLDFEALSLDLVLRQMQRSTRVGLVFLDACRNNPLASSLGQASRSLSVGRGLARVEQATGMLIAFATEPGSIALDGSGRNSPFTSALLKHIDAPNSSINDLMIEVRKEVMTTTGNKQVPWENTSLTGQFYFNPSGVQVADASPVAPAASDASPSVTTVTDSAIEHTFWTSIQDSNDPKLYQAYLRQFPGGVYAPIAESKLSAMRSISVEAKGAEPAPVQTAAVTPVPAASTVATVAPVSQDLAMLLQVQLKRVGCYTGAIDGDWGRGSRSAVERFNHYGKAALEAEVPTQTTLEVVSQHKGTICPVVSTASRNLATQPVRTTRGRRSEPVIVEEPVVVHRRPSVSFGVTRKFGNGSVTIGIGGGGFGGGGFRF